MARTTFPAQVLTPEGEAYSGEVEMVSTRTATGSVGILANHAPLMAALEPCELKLYESGSENPAAADAVRFAQGEGYLQVIDNTALLVVEDAIPPDGLDRADLEAKLEQARSRLEQTEVPDFERRQQSAVQTLASPTYRRATEERRRAEMNVKRYETFLAIEGGS